MRQIPIDHAARHLPFVFDYARQAPLYSVTVSRGLAQVRYIIGVYCFIGMTDGPDGVVSAAETTALHRLGWGGPDGSGKHRRGWPITTDSARIADNLLRVLTGVYPGNEGDRLRLSVLGWGDEARVNTQALWDALDARTAGGTLGT